MHVSIDGRDRPNKNSLGLPIAATPEALARFWDWFGDSKFVDSYGRPLVLWHGSPNDNFEDFRTEGRGKTSGSGAFFSDSEKTAVTYGEVRTFYLRSGSKVAEVDFGGRCWNAGPMDYEAFSSDGECQGYYQTVKDAIEAAGVDGSYIERPMRLSEDGCLEMDFEDDTYAAPTTDALAVQARMLGFSAFVASAVVDVKSGADTASPSTVYVVFNREQIRSVASFLPDPLPAVELSRRLQEARDAIQNSTRLSVSP
jgi:hypothetical protein